MASPTPPEKMPWRTVDEQLIDDVVQQALKEDRRKSSVYTCKVLVIVQSRELSFKVPFNYQLDGVAALFWCTKTAASFLSHFFASLNYSTTLRCLLSKKCSCL